MAYFVPNSAITVTTHDMHTAGEPLRIVTSGFPTLSGSVLDKRKQMKEKYDHYRKLLINEPRGHKDMYGVILLQKDSRDNSFEVISFQNEGYSTMCGHAVIALGRYVVDAGLVKCISPETQVNFHCPCGLVETYVSYNGTKVTGVRFHSVPAFVFMLGTTIIVPDFGNIVIDVSFGGAYYAIVEDKQLGLSLESSPLCDLINAAASVTDTTNISQSITTTVYRIPVSTEAAKKQVTLHHPLSKDLAFLYGTIITDGKDQFSDGATKNLCVFADKEVDRSPTGSGVTARIALQIKKGFMSLDQEKEFKSIIGTSFTGKAVKLTKMWKFEAVIVEVSGMAHHTGKHSFYLEDNDPLSEGFQLPV